VRTFFVSCCALVVGCGGGQHPTRTMPADQRVEARPPAQSPAPPPSPAALSEPAPSEPPTVTPPLEPPPVSPPPVEPPPAEEPAPPAAPGTVFRDRPIDQLLTDMATLPVAKVIKRFNRAEPLYWLELEGGLQVAFKPQTVARPVLWRNDVAAWELSRLLGLTDRVPPVTARALPLALIGEYPRNPLQTTKGPSGKKDQVWGSVIFWMPVLEPSRLAMAGQKRWERWLDLERPMPGADTILAAQTSTIVVFDYLQANSDRFEHPSNFMVDEHGDLVYRDNNEAWMSGLMGNLGYNRSYLELAHRFSRSLVAALRKTDRAALTAQLAPWKDTGRPILDELHLGWYEKRRVAVLRYIDALIRRHGEAAVLPFE